MTAIISFQVASKPTNDIVQKKWVRNTLSKSYLKPRVLQTAKTALSKNLVLQADSLYGVRAYNRKTGNLKWHFEVQGGVEGGLALEKDRILFGGLDGFFYCLELKTGLVLWKFYTGAENLGKPVVNKDVVYFLTARDKLFALNVKTGKVIWTYKSDSTSGLSIRGVSQPAIDSHFVYVGFSNGQFMALNKNNGRLIWKTTLPHSQFQDVDASAVVKGLYIYVASYDGGIYSLDKKNGRIVWRHKEGSPHAPTIKRSYLYYSSTKGNIIALNRFSGKVLWTQKTKGLATRPIPYKSFLVYGTSKGEFKFIQSKDGSSAQSLHLFKGVAVEPAIDSQEMYVMSSEAWLYKFSLARL